MSEDWQAVMGIVMQGHRVASGTGEDRRYPAGTLGMQKPFFAKRGLDLSDFFEGTVNLDIQPASFTLVKPAFTFEHVEWTHLHPPETFSFSHCRVRCAGGDYPGWVYTPHPETKAAHFQLPSIMEIITHFIPRLDYGDPVELWLNPEEIAVQLATARIT